MPPIWKTGRTLWLDGWRRRSCVGTWGRSSGTPIVPDDRKHVRRLLDTLLLDKAAYELGYELNNRPDWVDIPLRGLLLASTDHG